LAIVKEIDLKPEKKFTMKPLVITENCTKPFSGCVVQEKTSPCIVVQFHLWNELWNYATAEKIRLKKTQGINERIKLITWFKRPFAIVFLNNMWKHLKEFHVHLAKIWNTYRLRYLCFDSFFDSRLNI